MQESGQSQPGDPRGVSNLMDDEVRVCDTCGDRGREELLAICNKCPDGAEHIYCMRVKLGKVPEGDWTCEECMLRSYSKNIVQAKVEEAARRSKGHRECQKSESSKNIESSSSLRSKFRPSYAGESRTNGVSSTSHLSAKRHGVPLEAQSVKKARVIGMSAVLPKSTKPCNNYLLRRDLSCRKFKKEKLKSVNEITYALQISCNSEEKTKVLHASGDKNHASGSEAEIDKNGKALETGVIPPKASKPSNQSLRSRKPPFKKLGKAKLEAASRVTSAKQSSYGTREKAKLPGRLGDESPKLGSQTVRARNKCSLLASRSSKTTDLKSKGQVAKGGCLQKQKVERNSAFHDHRKEKAPIIVSKCVSFNSVSLEKSNATHSKVLLANVSCPKVLKNSSCVEETKTGKEEQGYELHNPAMSLPASDSGVTAVKSEKETTSRGETSFSVSNGCNLDAIQSCGQLDYNLQPGNRNTHKDLNCSQEDKKHESWLAEHPTIAATAIKIHKFGTDLASDERTHPRDLAEVEGAILSQCLFIPKPDYMWLGRFQIRSSEGIASTFDGLQGHLSTCASPKVLEVADRLPQIIILEELPRLRMWPSQFAEHQATEEHIALYFFAKDLDSYRAYYRRLMENMTNNDLALKGNLDGVELLIFPSNVLPEKCQYWNKMLFLWGVFRGRRVNNSANAPVSNSQKQENREIVKSWALDLNASPPDADDMARVEEIPKFDGIGTGPSGDRILLGGSSSGSGSGSGSCLRQALDIDLNLSLWPKDAVPKDGSGPSVRIEDKKTNEEKVSVGIEKHEANEDEANGDKNNNSNNGEPSGSLSPAPASPAIHDENLDLHDRQAADTLIFLSMGVRKI